MPEVSLRLPEEWARAVAARVARTIRNACGQEADKNADVADQIDDACDAAVSATLQVLAEEFNGRDRLHDDTALATAVARARREALEEAAEVADAEEMVRSVGGQSRLAGDAIRALAATPPEARQTETGWKPPAGWLLVPEEPTQDMLAVDLKPEPLLRQGDPGSSRVQQWRNVLYRGMVALAPSAPAGRCSGKADVLPQEIRDFHAAHMKVRADFHAGTGEWIDVLNASHRTDIAIREWIDRLLAAAPPPTAIGNLAGEVRS